MEACFEARFPQEGARQGDPDPQEFVSEAIQELQESRVMRGARRLPAVAPHPGEDGGLRVCVDVPGLNQVASLERLWPSRVGRCGGPPHSYIRMPYGLPNAADAYQPPYEGHHGGTRGQVLRSPGGDEDGPRGTASAFEASRVPWAWGHVRIASRSPPSLLHPRSFIFNIIR